MSYTEYKPGLDGIISNDTKISYLDTEIEQIVIRGYDLIELIKKCSYPEVAYLLLYNQLPSNNELENFTAILQQNSDIPDNLYKVLELLPKTASVMDALRIGISVLAGYHKEDSLMDYSTESNIQKGISILAKAPTIAANSYRTLKGMDFIKPKSDLGYIENIVYMIKGEKGSDKEVQILDKILTAYIEHEMPNSTFTTRVIASTLSDIYGSISSAVASLKGPLHGGANEAAMKMFLEVKETVGANQAKEYIINKLKNKEKVMGFGHRVYMRKYDPRAYLLKDYLPELANNHPDGETLYKIYKTIEETVAQEKSIYPNADYPIALLYYLINVPIELYTPLFLCSRIAGLLTHHIEQQETNKLFRPRVIYSGERGLHL